MKVKQIILVFLFFIVIQSVFSQETGNPGKRILFRGLVMDSETLSPIANSQILINKTFSSVSGNDGAFVLYVNRKDTVLFKSLGYKPTEFYISDTLKGQEFIAGIYMNSDTMSIGEVVIIPGFRNLKSEILNAKTKNQVAFDNARYNLEVSAYQGRNSVGTLGDPTSNYELLRQKQRIDASEKGGIPSDKMVSLSPLLLVPAAYLLINGLPEKPAPVKPELSSQELDLIQKKYFEILKQRK
jgi:hypothetical protein